MVCTANDLLGWKDFPKGLRVLLLDEDITSASEIRSKLEEMEYIVSTFCSENEALSAISENSKGFHVAIVEVKADNSDQRCNFLQSAKALPTIMISDVNCLSTMMKCIALGAVEFLKKPLSEEKLRNIWQHVAHKAFNGGPKDESEPLKPEKDSVETKEIKEEFLFETASQNQEHNEEVSLSVGSDKYPAPSTPQLKQGIRSVDNGDCQDHDQSQSQNNISMEKECTDHDGESKFAETTCVQSMIPSEINQNGQLYMTECVETTRKHEDETANVSKSSNPESNGDKHNEAPRLSTSRGTRSNRRKIKVDWTSELHKKFVQAVEKLGVDQAIPSRILELMNVEGLTRHNIASHLQKYRLQRRHILPKESERRWPQTRHSTPRNFYAQKPIMAYPPYHSNHTFPGQTYPPWVPPHGYPTQVWGPPYYPPWQSSESWQWNPYHGVQADAWGCPMVPPHPSFPQNVSPFNHTDSVQDSQLMLKNSFDHYPGEEILDKVVKEAINKPWLPLPLGLKPPSTESVITELSRQGISTVPSRINGSHPC